MAENKTNWNTVLIVLVVGVVGILLFSNPGILTGRLLTGSYGVSANSCDADWQCEAKNVSAISLSALREVTGKEANFNDMYTTGLYVGGKIKIGTVGWGTNSYACFDKYGVLYSSIVPCVNTTSSSTPSCGNRICETGEIATCPVDCF